MGDFLGLNSEQWLDLGLSILLVAAALVLGRWILDLLLKRLAGRLAQSTETELDDTLLTAVRPPLYWLLVVIILKAAINRLDFIPYSWDAPLGNLFYVADVIIAFVFVGRLAHYLMVWYGQEVAQRTETNLDEQLLPFFRRLAMVFLVLIGLIVLLGRFVDVSSLVTTLGVGSLAIALAAQAALSDTISGFLIMVDQPYRIGDRIEIQDLNTWGDVVDIGLRSTHIRTRDNRMVIVPNSVMGKSLIVNHAYPDSQYRIQIEIGVAYGTDLELARSTIIEAVKPVEGVLPDRPVEALFLQFGDSALIFRVRWWLESYVDTRRMFDSVNTAIYNALEEAGIEIPYPQLEVRQRND
jgi:small-conductance mechanosensitive channel